VKLDHIYLADRGIKGNGHMFMIEKNSDEIAGVVAEWLEKTDYSVSQLDLVERHEDASK